MTYDNEKYITSIKLTVSWPVLIGAEKQPSDGQGQQFESQSSQCAENWPWNCQGRQFENQSSQCAENRSRNCQVWQFEITVLKSGHAEDASHHGLSKWLKSGRETVKVGSVRNISPKLLIAGHQTAKVGSLRTWPWNCQGRQVESTKKSVVQTAKVGSSMATFSNFQIWQVYPSA